LQSAKASLTLFSLGEAGEFFSKNLTVVPIPDGKSPLLLGDAQVPEKEGLKMFGFGFFFF